MPAVDGDVAVSKSIVTWTAAALVNPVDENPFITVILFLAIVKKRKTIHLRFLIPLLTEPH
jgi:hypothetical protein